jgi:DNA repair protein RadC
VHAKDAYNVLIENWDDTKLEFVEQFKIMLMNRANKVLGIVEISNGRKYRYGS